MSKNFWCGQLADRAFRRNEEFDRALIGLHFMRHNSVVIDTTHVLIHFPHLTSIAIQTSAKLQLVLIQDNTTVQTMTTKTIIAFVDHPLEWHTTGTVTPVVKFTEAASPLKSHSISTITDKKTAARITNTTESPYLIKKNTQIAEFSVVTPEQSKFIKPVDTVILSMIPEGDPYLTTYLSELLRTNKPEQQNNTFWLPTPESPGKTEDHTLLQTRILKELRELQEKKLNPKYDVESRMKFSKRFDWTDTLLTEIEKISVEVILVEYHNTFAMMRLEMVKVSRMAVFRQWSLIMTSQLMLTTTLLKCSINLVEKNRSQRGCSQKSTK